MSVRERGHLVIQYDCIVVAWGAPLRTKIDAGL